MTTSKVVVSAYKCYAEYKVCTNSTCSFQKVKFFQHQKHVYKREGCKKSSLILIMPVQFINGYLWNIFQLLLFHYHHAAVCISDVTYRKRFLFFFTARKYVKTRDTVQRTSPLQVQVTSVFDSNRVWWFQYPSRCMYLSCLVISLLPLHSSAYLPHKSIKFWINLKQNNMVHTRNISGRPMFRKWCTTTKF